MSGGGDEPRRLARPSDARRARWLLLLSSLIGVGAGLASARSGLVRAASVVPAGAVAVIDGHPLAQEELDRALSFLAGDRRDPLTDADRVRVLETLVDEELLVREGIARGYLESERSVRDAVVRAMVDAAAFDAPAEAVGEYLAELRARARIEPAPGGAP